MIAGVCQGLAQSYGWDVVWVRVIAVLATVFSSGAGGIAYIVFWIVMPEELFALPAPTVYTTPPPPPEPWK
jgi:phage shock protein C